MGNTPANPFTDDREARTKSILKQALLTGNVTVFASGLQLVQDEFRQAAVKSKKDDKKGIHGHDELVRVLMEYLTSEFKITLNDLPEGVELKSIVQMADLSYAKTPLMHCLDFDYVDLCNFIKKEIDKVSKKQLTTLNDDDDNEGSGVEFNRANLAKQRLMAEQAKSVKPKNVTARPVVSAASMMTPEQQAMLDKMMAKSKATK
jgi:hypothetical protein